MWSTHLSRSIDAEEHKDWHFMHSENGWTSNDIGVYWLEEHFIPQTQPPRRHTWRLLILDNHGSHCTYRFMRKCLEKQIILLYFPPHCTHVLQPLDVAVFSPLKTAYRKAIGLRNELTLQKAEFIDIYSNIRKKSVTRQNIESGFQKSGLWPIDRSIPLSNSFVKQIDPPKIDDGQDNIPNSLKIHQFGPGIEEVVVERDLRSENRDLKKLTNDQCQTIDAQAAEIAMLKAQLASSQKEIEKFQSKKKRKKVEKEDSNTKLYTVRDILGTQQLVDLEEAEENARKKRREARNARKTA
jgi:hypothetical protein